MILQIMEIQNGATYENKVYDYFVMAKTVSGKMICIFDSRRWSTQFQPLDRVYAEVEISIKICDENEADFVGVLQRNVLFEPDYVITTQDGSFSYHEVNHQKLPPIGSSFGFKISGYCEVGAIVKIE